MGNSTQNQTTIATLIAFLAGILAGKHIFGFDTVTWTAILSAAGGLGMAVWSGIATRKTNIVVQANALDEVAGIVTKDTIEGRAMAESIPAKSVAAAGTPEAMALTSGRGT